MAEVKWIKITTSMFDDEKIKIIEKMPEGVSILLIWIKLLILAGKCNASGYIYLAENIPYTDEMISTIFDMPLNIIRFALNIFVKFNMVEITEDQLIKILNWGKHQNLEGLDRIREQTKLRVNRYRDKQKQIQECNVTDTLRNDIEVDKELDIDIEEDKKEDKKDIKKSSKVFSDESIPYRLAFKLRGFIFSNNPESREPDLQKWALEFDRLINIDKKQPIQIYEVMEWSQNHKFWKTNILSPKKLREQYPTLLLQKQEEKPKKQTNVEKAMERVKLAQQEELTGKVATSIW